MTSDVAKSIGILAISQIISLNLNKSFMVKLVIARQLSYLIEYTKPLLLSAYL